MNYRETVKVTSEFLEEIDQPLIDASFSWENWRNWLSHPMTAEFFLFLQQFKIQKIKNMSELALGDKETFLGHYTELRGGEETIRIIIETVSNLAKEKENE